jgi:hypothetical protein
MGDQRDPTCWGGNGWRLAKRDISEVVRAGVWSEMFVEESLGMERDHQARC